MVAVSTVFNMKTRTLSCHQIAEELGISPAYLSYMLNDKRPWRKDLKETYDLIMKRGSSTDHRADKSGVAQSGRAPAWGVRGRPRIRRPHAIMLE